MLDGGSLVGLTFTTPFSITSGVRDYTLQYSVRVWTGDDVIYAIGQSMSAFAGGPTEFSQAKLDETVRDQSFILGYNGQSTNQLNYPAETNPNNDPEDPDGEGSDVLSLLRPGQLQYVQKDIYLNAGCYDSLKHETISDCVPGGASATTINQWFYQRDGGNVPEVPEPATMLLFSTALLGLGFMRRKKS